VVANTNHDSVGLLFNLEASTLTFCLKSQRGFDAAVAKGVLHAQIVVENRGCQNFITSALLRARAFRLGGFTERMVRSSPFSERC